MKAIFLTGCGCSQLLEIEQALSIIELPIKQIAVFDLKQEYDYKLQDRTRKFKLIGLGYYPILNKIMLYREDI